MNPLAKLVTIAAIGLPSAAGAGMITTDDVAPYELCALCHSLDGNSRMFKFPKLAGQPAAYIEKQVRDFLASQRDNDGGQMVAIVTELSPEDIPVVAQWFASQPAPPPSDEDAVGQGKTLFADLGCRVCHDESQSNDLVPHLTAQHQAYLAKQMEDFRDGGRVNDLDGTMQAAMQGISDADIAQMARYLATTKRGFDADS